MVLQCLESCKSSSLKGSQQASNNGFGCWLFALTKPSEEEEDLEPCLKIVAEPQNLLLLLLFERVQGSGSGDALHNDETQNPWLLNLLHSSLSCSSQNFEAFYDTANHDGQEPKVRFLRKQ